MAAGKFSLAARGRNQGTRRRVRMAKYANRKKRGYAPSRWGANVALCPDSMFVKLNYSETISFQSASTIDNRIFRGNCHIDCNWSSSGTGRSAYGAAQWFNFYEKAHCTSSQITVRCISEGTGLLEVVLFPANTSFISTDIDNAASRSRNQSVLISDNNESKKMRRLASTKAVIGDRRNVLWNYVANPVTPTFPQADWYWHLVSATRSGLAGEVTYLVDIEYTVTFFDRKPLLTGGSSPI